MTWFKDIVINEEEETVETGVGLIWMELFSYLVPKGLNIVGGRLVGVGVGSFIVGGGKHTLLLYMLHLLNVMPRVLGYSWKINQYCLTIDTVTGFEAVLLNGSVKVVTEKDEDLWFALRVCLNCLSNS
jgi:hypothetical protein